MSRSEGITRIAALSAAFGLAGLGVTAASRAATRRWSCNPDPTGGTEFALDGVERTVVAHDGAALHTISVGAGRPVVLAPGWSGQSTDWAPVVNSLVAEGYRVIAYDRRGHGRSTLGESGFTLANLGLDMRAVVETYELDDATLVGHSLGGVATLMFATDHAPAAAAHIANLVLVATTSRWSASDVPMNAASLTSTGRGASFDHRPVTRSPLGAVLARSLFGDNPNQRLLDHSARRLSELTPQTVFDLVGVVTSLDISDQLESVRLPVRVVCGTEDRITPMADGELLAMEIPDAELHQVSGAGHMIPWERPGAILEAIRTNAAA